MLPRAFFLIAERVLEPIDFDLVGKRRSEHFEICKSSAPNAWVVGSRDASVKAYCDPPAANFVEIGRASRDARRAPARRPSL